MQQLDSHFSNLERNKWLLPPAIILGIGLGLFVSGYWLIDILPAGSKQLLLLTAFLSVLGALASYLLLIWARGPFAGLSSGRRVAFVGISLLTGTFLLLGGTSQWLSSARYVPFFLPSHQLR